MTQSLRQFGGYLVGFASLFLAWHVAATYMFASVLFPPPLKVLATAIDLARDGSLGENAAVSLRRIFLGFAGGSLIGIPVGLAIGSFRIGEGSKIFLIIYTTVFIVTINTAAGVAAVTPNKIRAARSLGASQWQVFWHVALPATMPYILTGMRLAMGNSFVTIIAAELVAANAGLGKMSWDARLYMLVDQIFVALLALGFMGFAADRAFRWAIYAFAGRFQPVT